MNPKCEASWKSLGGTSMMTMDGNFQEANWEKIATHVDDRKVGQSQAIIVFNVSTAA